jgi:hypothetical protein
MLRYLLYTGLHVRMRMRSDIIYRRMLTYADVYVC